MKWDEKSRMFEDELHFNEFVGWLYPRSVEGQKGDWESRRIARRDDIRLIAHLLRSEPDAFMQFRDGIELEKVYSLAQARKYEEETRRTADPTAQAFEAIQVCTKALDNIPYKAMKNDETKARLLEALKPLSEVIYDLTSR